MSLIQLHELAAQSRGSSVFLSIGFRPFFATPSIVGLALIIAWVFIYRGQIQLPLANMFSWHTHEMIYAYPTMSL